MSYEKLGCVRCGYCCNKVICHYGEDDGEGNCRFLKLDDDHLMIFSCEKRDEIMEKEKDTTAPMFENYCSSTLFNTTRSEVIQKIGKD